MSGEKVFPFLGSPPERRLHPRKSDFDYIVLTDLREALRPLAEQISGTILDYGCGVKPYSSLFTKASEYIGADFLGNPFADVTLNSDGSLPLESGIVDAVVSFQVLEHVKRSQQYLRECHRVLTRGAEILVSTHGIWEYHPGPHDLYRWTHEGLKLIMEDHAFETKEIMPVTFGLRSIIQLVEIVIRRRGYGGRPLLYKSLNFIADWLSKRQSMSETAGWNELPLVYIYHGVKKP